jgi:hypothetical protein
MLEKMQSHLSKLKERLHKAFGNKLSEGDVLKPAFPRKTVEESREEAVGYIVEKYFEVKKREEDYTKKLESYGTVHRWVFERASNLKTAGMVLKEAIVKPAIITALMGSVIFSILLAMIIGPQITGFTQTYLPSPFNCILDVLILFPIGFSPGIISIVLNYFREKRKLLNLLRSYGVEI